jgi:hypothetical protein
VVFERHLQLRAGVHRVWTGRLARRRVDPSGRHLNIRPVFDCFEEERLSHRAAATVAGTQNQYFHKLGCYMHRMMNSLSQNLNQQPNQIN